MSILLQEILEVCVIPLLGILTAYFVSYLKVKKEQLIKDTISLENAQHEALIEKYLNMAELTVEKCVITTNQTFVNSLKAKGEFNEDAWKEAFQMTYSNVVSILAGEAQQYLAEAVGDLKVYLTTLIESAVVNNKEII